MFLRQVLDKCYSIHPSIHWRGYGVSATSPLLKPFPRSPAVQVTKLHSSALTLKTPPLIIPNHRMETKLTFLPRSRVPTMQCTVYGSFDIYSAVVSRSRD